MTSLLQIQANRRNALRSTGPRTDAGREISSRNALKHGLSAERIILFDEHREEFESFFAELSTALEPQGPMETQLAERIAMNAWRLRRAYRVERGLFERARSASREGATEQTSDIDLVPGTTPRRTRRHHPEAQVHGRWHEPPENPRERSERSARL